MATRVDLPPLPPFDPHGDQSSLSQRWKAWIKRFDTYLIATNITDKKQRRAMLLYQAGPETQEIFETLTDTGEDYATAKEKLETYFSPKKNVDYEVFQFRQATQQVGETIDQFSTRLRKMAANCEFHNDEKEIKATIIQNCRSKRLRRYALREDLSLTDLITKARSLEISEVHATGMEEKMSTDTTPSDEVINQVKKQHKGKQSSRAPTHQRSKPPQPKDSSPSTCNRCGKNWPHSKQSPCPAKGQTCRECGKPNHFAKMCFSRRKPKQDKNQIKVIEQKDDSASSSDDEYIYSTGKEKSKIPTVKVTVNDVELEMFLDTGASTDILDEVTFQKINHDNKIILKPSSKRLFAYGASDQLTTIGQFEGTIQYQGIQCCVTIQVLKGDHGSLLSYKTATVLQILNLRVSCVQDQVTHQNVWFERYPTLFQGIGKLKDVEVQLHINEAVTPVAQQPRRIPFHIRQKVEAELLSLEKKGIIERVHGPTPWVSPLVIIPKKNEEIRICVDMRMANQAIERERHPMPTVDDLIHTLNGATVFSKLDLRSGYHQLPLAPESRYITTFATHEGLWRYKRLNFGTNSASEIFQKIIQDQLKNIPGALNISDDVIVYGKTQAEHDTALDAVCRQFAKSNLTLNKKKCQFNKSSITFFGFVFSDKGIAPDPKKVEAINNAPAPTTVSGVRSFLGMATYCAKFIPNFSDVSAPLREMTKKGTQFHWSQQHEQSFQQIKKLLTSAKVMAYFDQSKGTELTTDASPTGLSAILVQNTPDKQDGRVVAYASRTLSPVEQRYSQTEREALAIVWAIEKLHIYLFGSHFKLNTDCKPVQLIFDNPKSKPPARIERWNLRLQAYDFEVKHTQGSQNPSDFLSRHSIPREERKLLAEEYVNFLASNAVPKAMTLSEVQLATQHDKTLQCIFWLIQNQQWHRIDDLPEEHREANITELKLFRQVKEELTASEESSIILRNRCIVIPTALRNKAIQLAHEGHQGLAKTKQLLREKVWFPGIDRQVKEAVNSCLACQANGPDSRPDPLMMSSLPPEPWHTV